MKWKLGKALRKWEASGERRNQPACEILYVKIAGGPWRRLISIMS